MPNRSIRDEQQGVTRNTMRASDPAQVRAALAGNSARSSSSPASSSSSTGPVVRGDRPAVRGQSKVNINQGTQVRAQMDDTIDKLQKGS